jgi:hypothetical protein
VADIGSEVEVTGSIYGPWASEKTLTDLLDAIKDLAGTSEEQKKILQRQVTEIKNTGKASTGGATAGGSKNAKEVESAAKVMTTGLKESGQSALESAAGFDELNSGPLKGFGKSLKNASKGFKGMLVGVGLIGGAIGKYIKSVNQSVTVLRNLNEQGVSFEGSFVEVSRSLAVTGITLEQFGEMAGKYARVMGQNGLQGLLNLTKATEAAAGNFHQYGLTTAEATEYAAEYLDQQRMAGVFGKASEAAQAKALQSNIERLTAYSKVLNVSRQEMQDASREMLSNADLQAELFQMDPKTRAKAQAAFLETSQSFAALGAPGLELGKVFTDIAASPVAEASDGFQQLANAGLGDLAQRMVKLAEANKAGEGASLAQIMAMVDLTQAEKDQLAALRLAGGEIKNTAVMISSVGQASAEAKVSLESQSLAVEDVGKVLGDAAKKVDENVAAQTNLQDELSKFEATAEYGMVKSFATLLGGKGTQAVNLAADALGKLNEKALGFIDGPMVEGIEAFKDKAMEIWGVLKEVFADLSKVINDWVITPFEKAGKFINNMIQGLLIGWDGFIQLLNKIPGIEIQTKEAPPTMVAGVEMGQIRAEAARLTRAEAGAADLSDTSTASGLGHSNFEQRLLELNEAQVAQIRKMINEIRGGPLSE